MMPKKRKPPLVLIEWQDSHLEAGWQEVDFEDEALVCRSVGWLVSDGANCKAVAPHLSGHGHCNGVMTKSILRIVDLPDIRPQ